MYGETPNKLFGCTPRFRETSSEFTSAEVSLLAPLQCFTFLCISLRSVTRLLSFFYYYYLWFSFLLRCFPPFRVPQSVRLCFLPHLLALVWRDVWVLWGLTLHNRDNKGSFLCYRTEAHLWSPTASPLPGLRAAPAVGPIGWKSPPGFFLWHTECSVPGHMPATACSPWLPLHFRSPGAAEKLQ